MWIANKSEDAEKLHGTSVIAELLVEVHKTNETGVIMMGYCTLVAFARNMMHCMRTLDFQQDGAPAHHSKEIMH